MVRSYVCYFACFGLVVLTPCMPLQYGDRNHPVISKNSPYTTNTTCNGVKFCFFFHWKNKNCPTLKYLRQFCVTMQTHACTRMEQNRREWQISMLWMNKQAAFSTFYKIRKKILLIFLSFFFNVLGVFPSSGFKAAAWYSAWPAAFERVNQAVVWWQAECRCVLFESWRKIDYYSK